MVEQRFPKPMVEGSSPSAPANNKTPFRGFFVSRADKISALLFPGVKPPTVIKLEPLLSNSLHSYQAFPLVLLSWSFASSLQTSCILPHPCSIQRFALSSCSISLWYLALGFALKVFKPCGTVLCS